MVPNKYKRIKQRLTAGPLLLLQLLQTETNCWATTPPPVVVGRREEEEEWPRS